MNFCSGNISLPDVHTFVQRKVTSSVIIKELVYIKMNLLLLLSLAVAHGLQQSPPLDMKAIGKMSVGDQLQKILREFPRPWCSCLPSVCLPPYLPVLAANLVGEHSWGWPCSRPPLLASVARLRARRVTVVHRAA